MEPIREGAESFASGSGSSYEYNPTFPESPRRQGTPPYGGLSMGYTGQSFNILERSDEEDEEEDLDDDSRDDLDTYYSDFAEPNLKKKHKYEKEIEELNHSKNNKENVVAQTEAKNRPEKSNALFSRN